MVKAQMLLVVLNTLFPQLEHLHSIDFFIQGADCDRGRILLK